MRVCHTHSAGAINLRNLGVSVPTFSTIQRGRLAQGGEVDTRNRSSDTSHTDPSHTRGVSQHSGTPHNLPGTHFITFQGDVAAVVINNVKTIFLSDVSGWVDVYYAVAPIEFE